MNDKQERKIDENSKQLFNSVIRNITYDIQQYILQYRWTAKYMCHSQSGIVNTIE